MSKNPRVAFYLRVSTREQTYENQLLQLQKLSELEGWENPEIFCDIFTGASSRENRKGFDTLLQAAEKKRFDIIASWSIDRMGRETKDLLELANLAQQKGFNLFFHKDRVDTATASGELFFTIAAGMAKFERRRLQERVIAGIQRAKATGTKSGKPIGRPSQYNNEELTQLVHQLRAEGKGIKKIARLTGCAIGTVYKILETPQIESPYSNNQEERA